MPKTISANEAKDWIGYVGDQDDEVIVEIDGEPKAVIISVSEFDELKELREQKRRADALERLYAIRDERIRNGIIPQSPPEIDPERRAELLKELHALREEVRARNQDLTQEEADELANRFSREIIDDMVAEGKIMFERDLPKRADDSHPC